MDNPKDSTGRWRTRSLFVETIGKDQLKAGYKPTYSLNKHPKYVDLHSLYLEESDPTGYSFALRAFGSWEHFCVLKELKWFKLFLGRWEEELEVKMRSEGIREITKASKEGSRGVSAAKYIAERGWEKKRGRPSKAEVERQKRIAAGIEEELEDDASRLLQVVK